MTVFMHGGADLDLCESEKKIGSALLFALLLGSIVSMSSTSQFSSVISSTGLIKYLPQVDVSVDFGRAMSVNNLSLAVHLGGEFDFAKWRNDANLRQKVAASNFGLIRISIPEIQPCDYWNETTHTGKYDWTKFDITIEQVLSIGSKPLLVIGMGNDETGYRLPKGMIGNYKGTGFPSNKSFGVYVADLVRHTNVDKKWNIRYWEVWNEVHFYTSSGVNLQRIANFTKTFSNAARYMHNVDPSVLLGHGYSAIIPFFDYFLDNAQGFGFASYHDYDGYSTLYFRPKYYKSESEIINKASVIGCKDPGIWKTYSPTEMRQKWFERRGTQIPILITETNMNAAAINGTDPRMQTVFGAVWYAEKLRAAILEGVLYSAYFVLASDHSPYWNTTELTKGYGFGMINSTSPYTEWYPYWTNYLIGNHLIAGDRIYPSSTSNFTCVSVLAWVNGNHYEVLLIGKTKSKALLNISIQISEITNGTETLIYKIDENQDGIQFTRNTYVNPLSIILDGYSVVLVTIPF